jgi:hypothetical protein
MESKTDEIVEQRVVREVAGVVRTPEVLEKVVDALELNGFDRADIDVMADVETIRKRFGTVFVPVEEFADVPGAPRRAFVHRDDISMARATAFSVLFSIGATAAAGTASGGLGALAARHLGKDRAKLIETMIMEGGLVVWVRVRTEEAERRAEQIMRDGGAEAVRVHEIALDRRLSDLPLAGIVGDEVSGRA